MKTTTKIIPDIFYVKNKKINKLKFSKILDNTQKDFNYIYFNQNNYDNNNILSKFNIDLNRHEEINKTIEKMCLNFSINSNNCNFVIKNNIFDNVAFTIYNSNNLLNIQVTNYKNNNKNILQKNSALLKKRLKKLEINFNDFEFT